MAIGRRAQNHQHKFTFSALGLSGGGEREGNVWRMGVETHKEKRRFWP